MLFRSDEAAPEASVEWPIRTSAKGGKREPSWRPSWRLCALAVNPLRLAARFAHGGRLSADGGGPAALVLLLYRSKQGSLAPALHGPPQAAGGSVPPPRQTPHRSHQQVRHLDLCPALDHRLLRDRPGGHPDPAGGLA